MILHMLLVLLHRLLVNDWLLVDGLRDGGVDEEEQVLFELLPAASADDVDEEEEAGSRRR